MLVLARREGESLIIGDEITVTVLDTSSTQVRIGIDAPKSIRVDREEVDKRKKQAAIAGAQPSSI